MPMTKNITCISDRSQPNKLLMLLLANKGVYISGEEIAEKFQITRSAVWKQINALRNNGYIIDSFPRKGYCLIESPDLLLPEEIWANCKLKIFGEKIFYKPTTESTNENAKQLAWEGAPFGTIVIAERQQKGKGRMGRTWVSPYGGIWFSLILRPHLVPMEAPKLTIMAAVAVAEAINEATGICANVKWPNDILVDGKKVCGILTEMSAEMDLINYVVIGIGINANNVDFPGILKNSSTSLKRIKGKKISRIKVLSNLLRKLEYYYVRAEVEGFCEIFKKWRALCIHLGKKVMITEKHKIVEGMAIDIHESGALLVKTKSGKVIRVLSGDVSLGLG